MSNCKTVELLHQVAGESSHLGNIARSALGLVEDIRQTNLNPMYLTYLHELVEYIYQESGLPLHNHLQDDADCEICASLAGQVKPSTSR